MIIVHFLLYFYCTKCLYILLEVLLHFSGKFPCIQINLKLLSLEIVSALENKELLSRFRVYRKSATSAKTDGQISAEGPLYTDNYVLLKYSYKNMVSNNPETGLNKPNRCLETIISYEIFHKNVKWKYSLIPQNLLIKMQIE